MVQERLGERLRGYEFSTFVIIFTCVCFAISYLNAARGREASIEGYVTLSCFSPLSSVCT